MAKRNLAKGDDTNSVLLDKALSTVTIVGEVNSHMASQFRHAFRALERLKRIKNITVEINSHGGEIYAGFAIIDTIEGSSKPVTTRVAGVAMSMAALILASGGRREATPNSTVMVHQGSYSIEATHRQAKREFGEAERIERLTDEFLARRTQKPVGYWAEKYADQNLYLSADEALSEGIIDAIAKKG